MTCRSAKYSRLAPKCPALYTARTGALPTFHSTQCTSTPRSHHTLSEWRHSHNFICSSKYSSFQTPLVLRMCGVRLSHAARLRKCIAATESFDAGSLQVPEMASVCRCLVPCLLLQWWTDHVVDIACQELGHASRSACCRTNSPQQYYCASSGPWLGRTHV